MPLRDDLRELCQGYAETQWTLSVGQTVPTTDDLVHKNTGRWLDATVLYADIDSSTEMVDTLEETRSAEYYKAFLRCASRVIETNSGTITAYDGDRAMAIFLGDSQTTSAVTAALQIADAVRNIINPIFRGLYLDAHRDLRHTTGIDSGRILAAKAGVREFPDLVWVGSCANHAAKLTSLSNLDAHYSIRISQRAFARLRAGAFWRTHNGATIWWGPFASPDIQYLCSECYMELT